MLTRFMAHICALFAIVIVSATGAAAMTVQPVIVDLSTAGSRMSGVITVENTFATPLPVELHAVEASFKDDGTLTATENDAKDLLIFPPQAIIPPGRTQTFRVQWVGDPDIKESKHFILTVAQLPVKLPEGQSAVQILYNFQVIVSVGVAGQIPDIHVTAARSAKQPDGKPHLVLDLVNNASTYGYLADGSLRIVQKDATGKEVFRKAISGSDIQQEIGYGLVGANHKRTLNTPLELPVDGGTVEADFTQKSHR